jgi:hypothetical protein
LLQAVDCSDRELLLQRCQELVRDGHMKEGWRLPPDRPAAEHLPEHLPEHMAFDLPPEPTPEQLKEREKLREASERLARYVEALNQAAIAGVKIKPTSAAQTGLTDEEIQALMGDVSKLSDTEKKIRRYVVKKYGAQWKDVDPGRARTAAKDDPLFEKEVGVVLYEVITWRRALGRRQK